MKQLLVTVKSLLVLSAFLLSACSSSVLKSEDWQDVAFDQVWPEPPQPARIKLLRMIGNRSDMREDGEGQFFKWLLGEAESQLPLVSPYGIAADGKGRVWVADPAGSVIHIFDLAREDVDYVAQVGKQKLVSPVGLAYNPRLGIFYVSDSALNRVFALNPNGTLISEMKLPVGFSRPAGLSVGPWDDIFVTDVPNGTVEQFSPSGEHLRTITSAVGAGARFNHPTNVAVDTIGRLYVTDSMNFRVEVQSPLGELVSVIGSLGDKPGGFARPRGVAVDSEGHIYVVDAAFDNIQIFDMAGRLLLYFGQPGKGGGEFCLPAGIFIDQVDRIYLTESCNGRFQIFQYIDSAH